uniref:Ribonuclease H-like domain-containing protein n=1 Tax=Tanacetum cinerariifolium TaxID=118510 RepID=A0A6L2JSJ0_TANCI|nr:ribonuclease H-like domain-containing protein [Tanacetum cinerariifolium]
MNSKAFRVYNIRTRRVEEKLHVRFLEDKPIIVGAGPKWLFDIDMLTKSMNYVPVITGINSDDFVGTKDSIGVGKSNMETGSTQDYIFMPLWKDGSPLFNSSPKISSDAEKKHDEVSDKKCKASNELNYAFENLNTEYPDDPNIPGLETIATYSDSEEEADITNLESSIHVSPTPTTKTYKNNPLKQMDVKSTFLYERNEEEVYVCQPPRFKDPNHPDKVYKVVKALYGLHQAPRACQDKYVTEVLRKFNFSDVKSSNTLVDTKNTLVKDADCANCKKQTVVPTSTTEAEYVAAASCRGQVKTLNGEQQIQALVDKKKVIITEISVRSDLHLEDAEDEHVTTTSNDPLLSALEIESLKRRVKKLEKKANKKTHKLKRLYKIGSSTRVESSEDACLGDQEDASKQWRMIVDLDADEEVALIDETQGRNDQDMFDTSILDDEEVFAEEVDDEEVVAEKEVSTADLVPTTGKVVTTVGVEPEKPLKRKDQIMIDEEVARNLEAQMQAELEEKERLARQKEEEANIALVAEYDNTQAMMDADYELATRLQEEERGELTIEEKSRLFVKLMDKRKKYFARLKAEKIRKAFALMDTELVKGSEKASEGSSKRAAGNLEQEDAKRQMIEEENESAELKRCLEIIPDDNDDVIIKATPISSKSLTIVDYKIYKQRRKSFFKIIKADGGRLVKAMYLNEVFGYIPLIKTKLLIKKLEDSKVNVVGYVLPLLKDYNYWKSLC